MDFTLLIVIIVLAFLFDFINGFHDAANSIATIVSTKVLSPLQAVIWAAFFNFIAYAVFELKIADTIAKSVDTNAINLQVILAGIVAAILWNLLTWYLGIPSSSSHTLIGGFAGAAVAHAGWGVVHTSVILKIASFIFLAPILGMTISYIYSILLLNLLRRFNAMVLNRYFKKFQLVSSALLSLGHGGNDAQKVMGLISATLMVYFKGVDPASIPHWAQITLVDGKIHAIPHWIVLGCYVAISAGTISGGWKIVKTMGSKITKLTSFEAITADSAGATLLFGTDAFGIPVSTTHTITGAIMGTGLTRRI
ncbi:MAG: inorganic phosphate transporter, partial [Marinilabiliales bacterium]|nr:inorganic phosphate transporter [Marinilabiliales bacterium]